MTPSQKAIDLIKEFEGVRLKAYRCPAGVLTIGYGHTSGVKPGMVISEAQAEEFLREDLQEAVSYINSLRLALTQNMFDALVSFTFNVGIGNLSRSTLLTKVKADPYDNTILDEFIRWVYAKGKVLPGLQRRRLAEAKLYYSNT
ncbi:MAG: lysozyme [Bacteroidales bacterium]|nr:lysozyme [Bacteroidales bacterium]